MGAKGKSLQFTLIEKQNLSLGSTYKYAVLVLGLVTAGAGFCAPPLGMFLLTYGQCHNHHPHFPDIQTSEVQVLSPSPSK